MPRTLRVLAFGLLVSAFAHARDFAVVVHRSNPTKTLASADFVKMAKLTNKKWADGKNVVLVMKDPALPDMKVVLQKLFGMSADEVKALVQGNKSSFVIVDSDAAVVKTVETMPGAVGLMDVYSITGGVNVLKVDGKSPLEPGYLLHGQ